MKQLTALSLCILLALTCVFAYSEAIDLTNMSTFELTVLQDRISNELKDSHKTTSSQESKVKDLTKQYVESIFSQRGFTVSWAWFDYEYSREWGYITLKTHMDYRDGDSKIKPDVSSGVYLDGDSYVLLFLQVGDEIFLDDRGAIPDERVRRVLALDQTESAATAITPVITNAPTPTPAPTAVPTPISTPTPKPATPAPTAVSRYTVPPQIAAATFKQGTSSDAVLKVKQKMQELGYYTAGADLSSSYNDIMAERVMLFQQNNGLPQTGIIDDAFLIALYGPMPVVNGSAFTASASKGGAATSSSQKSAASTASSASRSSSGSSNTTAQTSSSSSGKYIGNRSSKKFHYPSCNDVKKMNESNKVWLGSRDEALRLGYSPCGHCRP